MIDEWKTLPILRTLNNEPKSNELQTLSRHYTTKKVAFDSLRSRSHYGDDTNSLVVRSDSSFIMTRPTKNSSFEEAQGPEYPKWIRGVHQSSPFLTLAPKGRLEVGRRASEQYTSNTYLSLTVVILWRTCIYARLHRAYPRCFVSTNIVLI